MANAIPRSYVTLDYNVQFLIKMFSHSPIYIYKIKCEGEKKMTFLLALQKSRIFPREVNKTLRRSK